MQARNQNRLSNTVLTGTPGRQAGVSPGWFCSGGPWPAHPGEDRGSKIWVSSRSRNKFANRAAHRTSRSMEVRSPGRGVKAQGHPDLEGAKASDLLETVLFRQSHRPVSRRVSWASGSVLQTIAEGNTIRTDADDLIEAACRPSSGTGAGSENRRITKSALVRESLEAALRGRRRAAPSCYDLARDLAGAVKGLPRDLAHNPKYMEGFGE